MRALEHEQRLAIKERELLEAAEVRMRQRDDALRQREETFRRRLNEELETQLRQARREIDDVIEQLKAKTTAIAETAGRQAPAVSTGDTGTARSDARAAPPESAWADTARAASMLVSRISPARRLIARLRSTSPRAARTRARRPGPCDSHLP